MGFYGAGPNCELIAIPERFEAGTPNVAGAVGLAAAIDYLQNIGMSAIRKHEIELNTYALRKLSKIEKVTILGPLDPQNRTGLVSFIVEGIHSHDLAASLNSDGIEVRSGTHCAMNLHKHLNIGSSTRASYYIYNDISDIDKLVIGVKKAINLLT